MGKEIKNENESERIIKGGESKSSAGAEHRNSVRRVARAKFRDLVVRKSSEVAGRALLAHDLLKKFFRHAAVVNARVAGRSIVERDDIPGQLGGF